MCVAIDGCYVPRILSVVKAAESERRSSVTRLWRLYILKSGCTIHEFKPLDARKLRLREQADKAGYVQYK